MWMQRKGLIVTKPTMVQFLTTEGHDNIEKLPMECKKDMLNFSEYFDEYSANIQYLEGKKA